MSQQIVWFFDKPTVYACPKCEEVAAHYTTERCPTCGGPYVAFTAEAEEVQAALDGDKAEGATGVSFDEALEKLKEKYEPRIRAVLERVREAFAACGYAPYPAEQARPIYEMSDEEYEWWLTVTPDPKGYPDNAIDVRFEINEQRVHEREADDDRGVTFRLDVARFGGAVLGGLAPGNYTRECWIDVDDEEAIEERFKLFEDFDYAHATRVLLKPKKGE